MFIERLAAHFIFAIRRPPETNVYLFYFVKYFDSPTGLSCKGFEITLRKHFRCWCMWLLIDFFFGKICIFFISTLFHKTVLGLSPDTIAKGQIKDVANWSRLSSSVSSWPWIQMVIRAYLLYLSTNPNLAKMILSKTFICRCDRTKKLVFKGSCYLRDIPNLSKHSTHITFSSQQLLATPKAPKARLNRYEEIKSLWYGSTETMEHYFAWIKSYCCQWHFWNVPFLY